MSSFRLIAKQHQSCQIDSRIRNDEGFSCSSCGLHQLDSMRKFFWKPNQVMIFCVEPYLIFLHISALHSRVHTTKVGELPDQDADVDKHKHPKRGHRKNCLFWINHSHRRGSWRHWIGCGEQQVQPRHERLRKIFQHQHPRNVSEVQRKESFLFRSFGEY